MSNWQPIEAAPKDRTAILGYAVGDMAVVQWSTGFYASFWSLLVYGDAKDTEWWPTHWCPLPEPPCYIPPTPSAPNPNEP